MVRGTSGVVTIAVCLALFAGCRASGHAEQREDGKEQRAHTALLEEQAARKAAQHERDVARQTRLEAAQRDKEAALIQRLPPVEPCRLTKSRGHTGANICAEETTQEWVDRMVKQSGKAPGGTGGGGQATAAVCVGHTFRVCIRS